MGWFVCRVFPRWADRNRSWPHLGRWGVFTGLVADRKPYRSDLSDAEWALIEPELSAWRAPRLSRKVSSNQPLHDLREIVNAILYVNRTGCAWEYLPHDFPPFKTVYGYFAA